MISLRRYAILVSLVSLALLAQQSNAQLITGGPAGGGGGSGTVTSIATTGPITGGTITTTGTIACATCATASGGAAANQIPKFSTATNIVPSLATDNGTTFAYTGTGGVTAPAFATTGAATGTLSLSGATSGTGVITVQSTAGTPTVTLGTSSGTPAVTASGPLVITTATGNIACATCVTSAAALTSGQLVAGAGSQASAVTNLTGDVTTSGGVATTLAAKYKLKTCTVIIGDPGAASPALADDNDTPVACANDVGSDWTITTVACWANAGSPTVTPILTGGSATSILTGALTCGTAGWAAGTVQGTPPVVKTFSGTGATCSATPCTIDVNITTAGGTAKYIVVKIVGTI